MESEKKKNKKLKTKQNLKWKQQKAESFQGIRI